MKGIIVNYRIAYTKEVLVSVHAERRDAGKLIGKKAVWTDKNGKKYIGYVSGLHGTGATLKVKFKKALPPSALAKTLEILE
jgi:ribosomal protein L35AE/L33A